MKFSGPASIARFALTLIVGLIHFTRSQNLVKNLHARKTLIFCCLTILLSLTFDSGEKLALIDLEQFT